MALATNDRTGDGWQGIVRSFCSRSKLALITEHLTDSSLASNSKASETALETSVHEFGRHWDFRENLWESSPLLEQWLLEEEPAQLAADLFSSDKVWLLRDQTYFKPPGSEHTPWNQDVPFIPVEGCSFLTLWIPLTPIVSSCDAPLEYWQASYPCCHLLDGGASKRSYRRYEQEWQEQNWTHLTTEGLLPGDCSYHDGWTLHGSKGHTGTKDRLAFVAVYGCGEGLLRLCPVMNLAPTSLRSQVQLLRQGLHRSCFEGLEEGDPVPGHHNPWIRCEPKQEHHIHSR